MATAQQCHTLISYYEKSYKEKYKRKPVINRNTARWNFDSMLSGMPPTEVKALIDYYFDTDSPLKHQLTWFFYNYDKLISGKQDSEEDSVHRAKLRKESEQRAQDWRDRFGNKGITSSQFRTEE